MAKSRSVPASGNRKTGRFFERVINILNSERIEEIILVEKLWDYKKGGKRKVYLCGLVTNAKSKGNNYIIYLSNDIVEHKTRDDIARTLLHEALHLLDMNKSEKQILIAETYWWNKFSKIQKNLLKFFIPRKVRKYKPSA